MEPASRKSIDHVAGTAARLGITDVQSCLKHCSDRLKYYVKSPTVALSLHEKIETGDGCAGCCTRHLGKPLDHFVLPVHRSSELER
jgi:hypothetical protein